MIEAIGLAWAAKGTTFPNPAVGAVVVSKGRVVGAGATQQIGGWHAEKMALEQAGGRARGATLYVTLEPCCHFGRTPPCTDAIISAGVKRVVAAVTDPNPLVRGKGFARLRAAGITVETGIGCDEATAVNEDFFWAVRKKTAWITLKLALTLDGRLADDKGESKWITGGDAREFVHELRRRHAAIGVGRTTLAYDNPRLTVRHVKGFNPARIVFATRRQIPQKTFFARHARETRSIVVLTGGKRSAEIDSRSGIEYWSTGEEGRSHLAAFREMAFENDLPSVFIEGGGKLASAFLEHGMVNRAFLFYGNKLFGSGSGVLFSQGLSASHCIRLSKRLVTLFDDTVMITGIPQRML